MEFPQLVSMIEAEIRKLETAKMALTEGVSKGNSAFAMTPAKPAAGKKKKGGITPEGKLRLSESMKARWAARRDGAPLVPVAT